MANKITDPSIDHPDYYGGDTPYEVIKVIEAWGLHKDGHIMTAVTYLARAGKKAEEEYTKDLAKAIWYIQRRIDQVEQEEEKARQDKMKHAHRDALHIIHDMSVAYEPQIASPVAETVVPPTVDGLLMEVKIDEARMREICKSIFARKGTEVVGVRKTPDGDWVIEYTVPESGVHH